MRKQELCRHRNFCQFNSNAFGLLGRCYSSSFEEHTYVYARFMLIIMVMMMMMMMVLVLVQNQMQVGDWASWESTS